MIQRKYSLAAAYRVAMYARMSTAQQNVRSPEQQADTIHQTMRRCGCPWTVVASYDDRAFKGRYLKRRPGLQNLLRDIALGKIIVDLIVVDTFERFGRSEEFVETRRKLLNDHGVLIVSADNGFADPTGVVGKAVGMIEQMRSTEDGRIKAHQVLRGKRDALRQKRWPGGPPPFGYRLHKQIDASGSTVVATLTPDPETAPILRRLFEKAHETGWGSSRLAQFFNADPTIPEKFKPFYASTIDNRLDNEIYVGVGIWGKVCTDIISDARVIEANPHPEEIVRVEDFCESLVSKELFDAVQSVRQARKRPKPATDEAAKLIKPISGGLSIKHPLAGLVHCGVCNACCVPRSSGRKSKAGKEYSYFTCPRHNDGACRNSHHVHVDRLTSAVFAILRQRLFPVEPGQIPPWFGDMVARIEAKVRQFSSDEPRRSDESVAQVQRINEQMSGWRQSLGNPQLSPELRQDLEREYEQARSQKTKLEQALAAEQAMRQQTAVVVDPKRVAEAIGQLDRVLSNTNACLVNVELARHVYHIDCFEDGRVELCGTCLGVFEGAIELVSDAGTAGPTTAVNGGVTVGGSQADTGASLTGNSVGAAAPTPLLPAPAITPNLPKVRSRRLARRKLDTLSDQSSPSAVAAQASLDPHRFAGLEDSFLWAESFTLSSPPCWSEANAAAVAAKKTEDPKRWSLVALAGHFGVSTPTIRKALRLAAAEAALIAPRPDALPGAEAGCSQISVSCTSVANNSAAGTSAANVSAADDCGNEAA